MIDCSWSSGEVRNVNTGNRCASSICMRMGQSAGLQGGGLDTHMAGVFVPLWLSPGGVHRPAANAAGVWRGEQPCSTQGDTSRKHNQWWSHTHAVASRCWIGHCRTALATAYEPRNEVPLCVTATHKTPHTASSATADSRVVRCLHEAPARLVSARVVVEGHKGKAAVERGVLLVHDQLNLLHTCAGKKCAE